MGDIISEATCLAVKYEPSLSEHDWTGPRVMILLASFWIVLSTMVSTVKYFRTKFDASNHLLIVQ